MNETDQVIADTVAWLERAVIGLNLCPFAKSVHVKRQVHYAVSVATTPQALLNDLVFELNSLVAIESSLRDTTLLIAPYCLQDFLDFNDFLAQADQALLDLELDGVLQIASLHPLYQFGGTLAGRHQQLHQPLSLPDLAPAARSTALTVPWRPSRIAEAIFETNMQTHGRRWAKPGWDAL
jgi:hypothetical protein